MTEQPDPAAEVARAKPKAGSAEDYAVTLDRDVRAVELAISGLSYDEIARQLGYVNRSGAWKAVHRSLERRENANADSLRALRGAQLDKLLGVALPKAAKGDWAAYDRALRTLDRLIRLEGLDLPVQVQVSQGPAEHEVTDPAGRLALVHQLRQAADGRVIDGETVDTAEEEPA